MDEEERQRYGEEFLCALYAMGDGNVAEFNAEDIYTKISYNLEGFEKKGEKKGTKVNRYNRRSKMILFII
jgi:hypothetical protein